MTRGRCFLYESGDADRVPGASGSGSLQKQFLAGVTEASKLFEIYTEERRKLEEANAHKVRAQKHLKPPLYTRIQTNRAFGDCPVYTAERLDQQMCECDEETKDPCGETSECLNRLLRCECRPTCLAGDKCGNQRFQRRKYPKLKVTRTATRGWGLTVHEDIKRGSFLIEYVGELITMAEFHRRIEQSRARKEEHNYYYMTVDNNRMIDAGPKGNIARFMNHSCDPNCETQKWTVNGDTRVGLFALKDIADGEELTFNYQFEAMGEVKQVCLCGAKNCSGFIGEKPVKTHDKSSSSCAAKDAKDKDAKKKKKIKKITKTWEDICFRCYEDGILLMCDWKNCPKVYHLACLGRDKMPREKWFCPWHHCVECGKPAVNHCIHCPNAYCKTHDNVLMEHKELGKICDEHQDDVEDLISFYRRVPGGVRTLVSDPNVAPPKECPEQEESQEEEEEEDEENEPEVTVENKGFACSQPGCEIKAHRFRLERHLINIHGFSDDEGKKEVEKIMGDSPEKSAPAAVFAGTEFACTQEGCAWSTNRRQRLARHLVFRHQMSEEDSNVETGKIVETVTRQRMERLAAMRQIHTPKYRARRDDDDNDVPTHIMTGKKLEVLLRCPVCKWAMRGSNLYRHISIKHPEVDVKSVNPEKVLPTRTKENRPIINRMMNHETKLPGFVPRRKSVFSKRAVVPGKPRLVREEEKANSPGHSLCTKCGKYIHITNTARHWRMRHPKEKYSPTKMKHNQPNYVQQIVRARRERRAHRKEEGEEEDVPSSEKADDSEDDGILYCGYPECKFSCLDRQELEGHRKDKGHPKLPSKRSIKPTAKAKLLPRFKQRAISHLIRKKSKVKKCGYDGCDYKTIYNSNLNRHKKRSKHFDDDSAAAATEESEKPSPIIDEIKQEPIIDDQPMDSEPTPEAEPEEVPTNAESKPVELLSQPPEKPLESEPKEHELPTQTATE